MYIQVCKSIEFVPHSPSTSVAETMNNIAKLIRRRDRARKKLAHIGELQPGTLQENYTRCGRQNCRCATDPDALHGPHYMINRSIGGKTRSMRLRENEVDTVKPWLNEFERFKQVCAEFLEASELLADERLADLRKHGLGKKKR